MQGTAAKLLRAARDDLGLTQYEVAQRAGIREYDVSRRERGVTRTLPLAGLRKLCRVLGLDLEQLADALLADEATRGDGASAPASAKPPKGSAARLDALGARRAETPRPRPASPRRPRKA